MAPGQGAFGKIPIDCQVTLYQQQDDPGKDKYNQSELGVSVSPAKKERNNPCNRLRYAQPPLRKPDLTLFVYENNLANNRFLLVHSSIFFINWTRNNQPVSMVLTGLFQFKLRGNITWKGEDRSGHRVIDWNDAKRFCSFVQGREIGRGGGIRTPDKPASEAGAFDRSATPQCKLSSLVARWATRGYE